MSGVNLKQNVVMISERDLKAKDAKIAKLTALVNELFAELRQVRGEWADAPDEAMWLNVTWKWSRDDKIAVGESGFYNERRPADE